MRHRANAVVMLVDVAVVAVTVVVMMSVLKKNDCQLREGDLFSTSPKPMKYMDFVI